MWKKISMVTLGTLICIILSGCLGGETDTKTDGDNEQPFMNIIATPPKGCGPLTVSFYAEINNPKANLSSYHWDFGDGITSDEETPTHLFSLPGTYSITLTVALAEGSIETGATAVMVYDKSQFFGIWHYSEGPEYYETIILHPNGTMSLTFADTGILYPGVYVITNNTIQFSIPEVHHQPSFQFGFDSGNMLILTSIRENETSIYLKERLNAGILYVGGTGPDNYTKIQEAIDEAWYGDTIFVFPGTYFENIQIKKTVNLIGYSYKNTIIDSEQEGNVIEIQSNNVNVSNFTVRNSKISSSSASAGIKISQSTQVHCNNCSVVNNYYGIWLYASPRNSLSNCTISHNTYDGIMMHEISSENIISDCIISENNGNGIALCCGSNTNFITMCTISSNNGTGIQVITSGNIIYLNNFINNSVNAYDDGTNVWDNGYYGNYWSDFDEQDENAFDTDDDGIINTPYRLKGGANPDRRPLLHPL